MLSHHRSAQVPTSQTESLHRVLDVCVALDVAVADALVLHKDRPTAAAGKLQPRDISHVFVGRDSVDLGKRVHSEPGGA